MPLQLVKTTIKLLTLPLGLALVLNHGSVLANQISIRNDNLNDRQDTTTAANQDNTNQNNYETRFSCELIKNQYVVTYRPQSQPDKAYPWAVPGKLGGGWSAKKRCQEISRRLESYRPDGLRELGIAQRNNNSILCVTTETDKDCRIVLTVPPGKDPVSTRNLVFYNLLQADKGETTEAVKTFAGDEPPTQIIYDLGGLFGLNRDTSKPSRSSDSQPINLRPFLDRADGGTGREIKGNRSNPSGNSILNPRK